MEILQCGLILCFLFWVSDVVNGGHLSLSVAPPRTFDVTKFGALGDGKTDDTKAFVTTWRAACTKGTNGNKIKIIVPKGKTFLVNQIAFEGPCGSTSIIFEILGTIIAPRKPAWRGKNLEQWLHFHSVSHLKVVGNNIGVIDGQGASWWQTSPRTKDRPTALRFTNCIELLVSGLKHINSQNNHISLTNCNGVAITKLHIIAPKDSPNTDGINIGYSTHINIHHCTIQTGDDCIAVNGGTSSVNITKVACGPGHGISIGSLGKYGGRDEVEGIYVSNCNFTGSQNGARIKTWEGGSGFARNIHFSDITLKAAHNPIIIDQFYNPNKLCESKASAVKVSDVTYKGIRGTTTSETAINFSCSRVVPCTNIIMENINITTVSSETRPPTRCFNAQVTAKVTQPPVNCKSKSAICREK